MPAEIQNDLADIHYQMLNEGSGILPEVIAERGYRSVTDDGTGYNVLLQSAFAKTQAKNRPGLLLPLWTTDGAQALMVYRPDRPRPGKDGHPIKYEIPQGTGVRLDCPPRCQPRLADPSTPLWISEGQKKADSLASHGAVALALLGVYGYKGKNPFGGTTFLADWDYVALKGREARIVYDSDVMVKPSVRQALERLTEHLRRKGAAVHAVYLPTEQGHKVGVDDYLVAGHSLEDLEGLIEGPRPQPQAAPAQIELLKEAPATLSRLLAWIDGHAYAATWLSLRVTATEYVNRQGEVTRIAQPQAKHERRMFVMRDDGVLFGEAIAPKVKPLAEIGIDIAPMDKPPDRLLWNADGVTAYLHRHRPEPAEVFARVVSVYNHFLDFSRSLDEQQQMCRLSACLSFMTWFADAFTVLPYPWPNSPAPGSGKTKWGHCWTCTAYLGYLTAASGSFAALRDLADMGASLLLDDAEILADPQKADPDKQMLILAGNRKGVSIPVKEQGPDGRWHTRWLNAYCPRGFTSLRLPFRALQSRSIVLPLVASADAQRANRDPQNAEDWPVDQSQLRADLWALGLSLQREAADMWNNMSTETSVVGRDWERWRAVMTVARLFEHHGVTNLTSDMMKIMSTYNEQREDLEGTSRISYVIQALMRIAGLPDADKWTSLDIADMSTMDTQVQASKIVDMIRTILREKSEDTDDSGQEEEGKKTEWPNSKAVGIILSRLRLRKDRGTEKGRSRYRLVSQQEVAQIALAHHVVRYNMSATSAHVHMSDDAPLPDPPHTNGAHGAPPPGAQGCPHCQDHRPPTAETYPDGSTALRCPGCGRMLRIVPRAGTTERSDA